MLYRLCPVLAFVILLLTGCTTVRPAEESADMIVAYTIQEEQVDQFMGAGFPAASSLPEGLQQDMLAFIKKHMDFDVMRSEARTFYLERFSAEELAVIADYHATEAAQKFQQLSPELAVQSTRRFQEIMVNHRDNVLRTAWICYKTIEHRRRRCTWASPVCEPLLEQYFPRESLRRSGQCHE